MPESSIDGGGLPGLAPAMLRRVREEVPELAEGIDARVLVGGRSNVTFLLTGPDGQRFVLRRPPLGGVLASAHDMAREWSFISALRDTPVPVAVGRFLCRDPDVADAPFYVMEYVDGRVLKEPEDVAPLDEARRHRLGLAVVDTLAALHTVDPVAVGLVPEKRARSASYVLRQLDRWRRQVALVGVKEGHALERLAEELGRAVPPEHTRIAHGDFRLGNLSVSTDGRVLAVFDWELATVGDTMADLGWLISSWREPGEDGFYPITGAPSSAAGFPSRAELVDRYAAVTGIPPDDLAYYEAFARWRMGCITVGVRHRYTTGYMGDDGFDPSGLTPKIADMVASAHAALARRGDA